MSAADGAIVWVHGDCLDPNQPALADHPACPAVWVWDDALLRARRLSLKRIVFLYECLLELPVAIRRGEVAAEVAAFAAAAGAATVITMVSPSPGFRRTVAALRRRGLEVRTLEPEPFVALPREPDLRRFSRYWRAAQPQLQSAAHARRNRRRR